jgi:plastocyanin
VGARFGFHDVRFAVSMAVLLTVAACGGGDGGGNPTGPGGGSGAVVASTGSVGTIGATITIANGSVSPSQVTISVGQSVRFVNNDGRSRDMSSDPHPNHTNCPSLNRGIIGTGQSRDSFGFAAAGSCGFHDHNDPDNNGVKGRVVIQ